MSIAWEYKKNYVANIISGKAKFIIPAKQVIKNIIKVKFSNFNTWAWYFIISIFQAGPTNGKMLDYFNAFSFQ